jgi:hypothetical protein
MRDWGIPADRRRFVIGVIASRLGVRAGSQAVRQGREIEARSASLLL